MLANLGPVISIVTNRPVLPVHAVLEGCVVGPCGGAQWKSLIFLLSIPPLLETTILLPISLNHDFFERAVTRYTIQDLSDVELSDVEIERLLKEAEARLSSTLTKVRNGPATGRYISCKPDAIGSTNIRPAPGGTTVNMASNSKLSVSAITRRTPQSLPYPSFPSKEYFDTARYLKRRYGDIQAAKTSGRKGWQKKMARRRVAR